MGSLQSFRVDIAYPYFRVIAWAAQNPQRIDCKLSLESNQNSRRHFSQPGFPRDIGRLWKTQPFSEISLA